MATTHDRIFCPLRGRWFDLIKAGRKTWEFRHTKSPVAYQISKKLGFDLDKLKKTSTIPSPSELLIEFRQGYNGEAAVGMILEIRLYPSPDDVEEEILREACVSRDDLHPIWLKGHLLAIRFVKIGQRIFREKDPDGLKLVKA